MPWAKTVILNSDCTPQSVRVRMALKGTSKQELRNNRDVGRERGSRIVCEILIVRITHHGYHPMPNLIRLPSGADRNSNRFPP